MLQQYELPRAPHVTDDAWFSTAFSASGQFCAVASQGGIVTVFDAQLLGHPEVDPVVEHMASSRPHGRYSKDGAVRSICFSPEPWNLLICVEHAQRICVFDTRSGFRLRQVITLEHQFDTVERAEIFDSRAPEDAIDPRLRNAAEWDTLREYQDQAAARDEAAAADFTNDYIDTSAERRRLQHPQTAESPELFTFRERPIEALRTSRDRLDAREPVLMTINYVAASAREGAEVAANSLPPPPGSNATSVIRNYYRDRRLDRDELRTRPYEPRRRSSVVLTQNGPVRGGTPHELSDPRLGPTNVDPWRAIEAVPSSSSQTYDELASTANRADGAELGAELNVAPQPYQATLQEFERLSNRRRQRPRNPQAEVDGTNRHEAEPPRRAENELCLNTSGCCMSPDGRRLYVTERLFFYQS